MKPIFFGYENKRKERKGNEKQSFNYTNRWLMMMAAAMTMSAAPAVYAAERADSETIKEDNQPTEEAADASEGRGCF
ncbi:MAG: hypothetical protein ACLTER_18720 [Ruminococcus sp.]